jgi:hypothetical protein
VVRTYCTALVTDAASAIYPAASLHRRAATEGVARSCDTGPPAYLGNAVYLATCVSRCASQPLRQRFYLDLVLSD